MHHFTHCVHCRRADCTLTWIRCTLACIVAGHYITRADVHLASLPTALHSILITPHPSDMYLSPISIRSGRVLVRARVHLRAYVRASTMQQMYVVHYNTT